MKKYINGDELNDIFFDWMQRKFGVDEEDRLYILMDFVAPDECMWLNPEGQPDKEINGEKYSSCLYTTDFSMFQTFSNIYTFSFYEYTPLKEGGEKLYEVKES